MEIIIGALVLAVVIYFIVGSRKMSRWNDDPKQQELVRLLVAEGTANLTNFIIVQDWSPNETRQRLAHALTIVQRISAPAVYEKARNAAQVLYRASRRLG